jgi:predicted thioesterase
MNNNCQAGDTRIHSFKVSQDHFPSFEGQTVHKVCSTYVLAREIEWSTRLFVLDMLEENEEGIGTMLKIDHISPAFKEEKVIIEATLDYVKENEILCSFHATVGDRVIAKGKTGQKIFKKDKLKQIFSDLSNNG